MSLGAAQSAHDGSDEPGIAASKRKGAATDAVALVDLGSFAASESRSALWSRAAAGASGAAGAGMGLGPDMFIKPIVMGMLGPSIMDFVQKMGNYAGSLVPARMNEFLVSQFAGPTPLSIFFMIIDLLDMVIGALQMAFGMAAQLKMLAFNTARNAILQANLAKAQADAALLSAKRAAEANMLQSRLQAIAVLNMVRAQMLAAKAAAKAAAMAARANVIAGMKAARSAMAAAAAQARAAAATARAMKGALGGVLDGLPRPVMPSLPGPAVPELPMPPPSAEAKASAAATGRAAAAAGAVQAAESGERAARSSKRLRALADASSKAAAAASAVVAAAQSPAVPATTRSHLASVAARAAQVQSRAERQAATVSAAAEELSRVADDSARAAIAAAERSGQPPPPTAKHAPPERQDDIGDVGRAAAAAAESVAPAAVLAPPPGPGAIAASWYDSVRAGDSAAARARAEEELPLESGAVDAVSLLQEMESIHDAHRARRGGRRGAGGPLGLSSGRPVMVDVALALRSAARSVADASRGLEDDLAERAAEGLSEASADAALASVRAAAAFPAALGAHEGLWAAHDALGAFLETAEALRSEPRDKRSARGARVRRPAGAPDPLDAVDVAGPSFLEVDASVRLATRSSASFRHRFAALARAEARTEADGSTGHASGAALAAAAASAAEALVGVESLAASHSALAPGSQTTMKQILDHAAGPDYDEMGEAEKCLTRELKTDASKVTIGVMSQGLVQDVVSDALAFTWPAVERSAVPAAMEQAAKGTSLAVTAGVGYAVTSGLVHAGTAAVARDTRDFAVRALSTQIAGAVSAATGDMLRLAQGGNPEETPRGLGGSPAGARGISRFAGDDLSECAACARRPGGGGFAAVAGFMASDAQKGDDGKALLEAAEAELRSCDQCSVAVSGLLANGSAEQLAYRWVRTALVPEQLQEAWLRPVEGKA